MRWGKRKTYFTKDILGACEMGGAFSTLVDFLLFGIVVVCCAVVGEG